MSDWDWSPRRKSTVDRAGSAWLGAFSAIVPFVTVGILLLMFHIIGGTMTTAKGVLFDLPETGVGDAAVADSVALLVPVRHETHVIFDDSRYVIGSAASMRTLGERLAERFARSETKALLVLSDRRVSCGDLMQFAETARRHGVGKVLFAEKGAQEATE